MMVAVGERQGSGLFRPGDGPMYIITLGHALTHWYPSSFFLVLPLIAVHLELSYTQIGVLITIRSVIQALVNIPGGAIVDMVGRRGLIMALSLLWCCIPYFFLGLSDNYALIVIASGLMGVGNNMWHPAAISDLSERYPTRRGWALSIHALGANLGDMLGPLVVGFLLVSIAYNQVFIGNLVPGLVLAGLFFVWLRGAAPAAGSAPPSLSLRGYWEGVVGLARNSGVMLLTLVGGLRAMTDNGLRTFIPFYLTGLGMGPALIGVYLAVVQGAGLIASPISGWGSDRFGRKPVVAGGMLATTIVIVIFTNLSFLTVDGVNFGWIFVGVLSLLGFFMYAMRPALQAWTMDMVPREMGGTTVGLMFGSQSLFAALSPALGGILADAWGLMAAFYFIATTVLIANVVVMLVPDRLNTKVTAAETPVGPAARSTV